LAQNNGRCSPCAIRIHEEMTSLKRMLELMQNGVSILENLPEPANQALLFLINLGRFICCSVQTGIHAKQWFLATSKLKIESNKARIEDLLAETERIANAEIQNAESAIPLVMSDSRLGWEPSMAYMADAEHIRWKIRQVNYVIDTELKQFKQCLIY